MTSPLSPEQNSVEAKRAMRSHAKEIRSQLTDSQRDHASGCLAQHASQLPDLMSVPKNGVVGGYYPLGGEINPLPLLDWMWQLGWSVALPVVEVEDSTLVFRKWEPGSKLEKGYQGIMQPLPDALECQPTIMLIPLLAFDRFGRRLGYGGGYYDRTLSMYAENGYKAVSIGVAFSQQEVENVPFDDWDYDLDMILTERGICRVDPYVPAS